MQNYKLINGIEQNALYPDTFEIPSVEEKSQIGVDSIVKLVFVANDLIERMWVIVTKVITDPSGTQMVGLLDNDPISLESGLKYGDEIKFTPDHVISIFPIG